MSTADRFWARRLRWRLLGAWRWPLFLALTVLDGFIAYWLPPWGSHTHLIAALIICSFANLILIGAIAPWFGRRLAEREGQRPPTASFPPTNHVELLTDRAAAILLVVGTIGVLSAGLSHRHAAGTATDAEQNAADTAVAYVTAHGPAAARKQYRIDALNTHVLEEERLYRMCVPLDDRALRNYCMYIDVTRKPPSVRLDPDARPNQLVFPGSG